MIKFLKGLILMLIIPIMACDWPWSHEEIGTTAILNLSIINKLTDTLYIKYVRPREFLAGDSVYLSDPFRIEYRTDSFSINPLTVKIDTITYIYQSLDYCTIEKWIAKDFRINVEIRNDSLILSENIFPWDTSIGIKTIDNCRYVSYDTINIQ
jgi:hypothetical protein